MLLKETHKECCARMRRFFEEAENYSNDKNVYHEVPPIEVYLEPSQTSTMKFFFEKSRQLFWHKTSIVDVRLGSQNASGLLPK